MNAISSSDPQAVELLTAKLATLEAKRNAMKMANAAYKAAVKLGVAGMPFADLPGSDRDYIIRKSGLPVNSVMLDKAVEWKPAYSFEKGPFVGWPLTNLGANIRTVKARIDELTTEEAHRELGEVDRMCGDIRIVENVEDNRIQLFFPGKPDIDVRTKLIRHGFKWAPSHGAWQRHLNVAGRGAVDCVLAAIQS